MRRAAHWPGTFRRVFIALGIALGLCAPVSGQPAPSWDGSWAHVPEPGEALLGAEAWVRPAHFTVFRADLGVLEGHLRRAPLEFTDEAARAPLLVPIPMPNGGYRAFEVFESPVMEPELAAKYPDIRTFAGQGVDDPASTVRLDLTRHGFHAQVLGPGGRVMVDPLNRGDRVHYASYFAVDQSREHDWVCEGALGVLGELAPAGGTRFGETLRTYRLANAATGEYTIFHGGTVADGLAAIVTAVNRVNQVYEREVAVRLVLVGNNDLLVFTNPNTDPYTNNNGVAMLSQNISTCNSIIGSANYDIGHVFSTGGGGVAYLGSVCTNSKAGGVTGLPQPRGDAFYIDYVAHEMGHQFGANHCFNSPTGSCGGNRSGSNAYEPGSASTIMGYAGLCGQDNIQTRSDAYFGSNSFSAIRAFIESGSGRNCDTPSQTGNTGPTVDAGPAYAIPAGTPFTLTATGSDPDGDALTFAWEQRDRGPAARLTDPDDGRFPLNRSYEGTASPSRKVPRLSTILANGTDSRDRLPEVSRNYRWRVTARDNRAGGGGVAIDEVTHTVVGGAGPFDVTRPAGGEVWSGFGEVAWAVAGTDQPPIQCTHVNILLSVDGGQTFPVVLASNTPNDGHEVVAVPPGVAGTQARVRVEPVGNIFFDINPAPFVVELTPPLLIDLPEGGVFVMAPGEAATFLVRIDPGSEGLEPGSEALRYSYDGGAYALTALVPLGGVLYEATLPGASCDDSPRYYVEARGDGGSLVTLPEDAPASAFEARVGELEAFFSEDFEDAQGWIVDGNATGGVWVAAVPVGSGFGDPPSDADGSGKAYVTGNAPFDDVRGETVLIAPSFDLSAGGAIGFSYWLSGFPGVGIGPGDGLFVEVATDPFSVEWVRVRSYTEVEQAWRRDLLVAGVDFDASPTVRVRFVAVDAGDDDVVEAGLDAFEVSGFVCDDACVADFNGDGRVDTQDVLAFLNAWSAGDGSADVNGDGRVDTQDVLEFLNLWNAGC
jgi:hypothetical protein